MEGKRINYNAPFLSVRRFYSSMSSESKSRERRSGALDNPEKPSPQPVKQEAGDPIASPAAPSPISPLPLPHRNSELQSGPVRDPGVVPFSWEEAPGCPKGSTSAANSASDDSEPNRRAAQRSGHAGKEANGEEEREEKPPVGEGDVASAAVAGEEQEEEEEEEAFSDALDTLSKAESCFMNCSLSGMTGFTESVEHPGVLYQPAGDPRARDRDFMIGRFLPAAQAVATAGSTRKTNSGTGTAAADNNNNTFRRASACASPSMDRGRPLRFQQPKQHQSLVPRYLQQQQQPPPGQDGTDYNDDDEDDRYSECGQMQIKGCGFLPRFCLKGFSSSSSSSFFMNPLPGVRAISGRTPSPLPRKRSPAVKPRLRSVGVPDKEQTWEAVYRHKQVGKNRVQLEDASKLTSESNRLTYWSTDSQSQDGSSPYRRSTGGDCLSPNQNELEQSPQRPGKCFLGSPLKANSADSGSRGSEKYFEIQPHLLTEGVPRSESQDSIVAIAQHGNPDPQASPKSRGSFGEAKQRLDVSNDHYQFAAVEASEGNHAMEVGVATFSAAVDPPAANRFRADIDATAATMLDAREKDQDAILLPHLPPPLPKTPSESWLSRTLPSVTSKNQLGLKFDSKKKGDRSISPANPKWETAVKDSRRQPAQMRFSEILANPIREEEG